MSDAFSAFDKAAMARAVELAERGLETAHPNPRVGCVIARDEQIISEGWHEWPGEVHAEAMALRTLGGKAPGATAYVSLEPCSHFGRTPPCANALIDAGISRVVFAVQDPNPRVNGGGAAVLRAAGIQVESGLMATEAEQLNLGFLKRMRVGLPWVRLKLAMSLDGRTALANGVSQWITGAAARDDVQHWRAQSSAVMTGIGTVLADDPRLNVRLPAARRRHPLRVILDSELRTPPGAKVFSTPGETIIFTASDDSIRRRALEASGARIEHLPRPSGGTAHIERVPRPAGGTAHVEHLPRPAGGTAHVEHLPQPSGGTAHVEHLSRLAGGTAQIEQVSRPSGGAAQIEHVPRAPGTAGPQENSLAQRTGMREAVASAGDSATTGADSLLSGALVMPPDNLLDLSAVLQRLAALDVNELLVEAGATLAGSLIRANLVDELLIYMAPMLLGPQARALANLPELTSLDASPRFSILDSQRIGTDLRLRLTRVN